MDEKEYLEIESRFEKQYNQDRRKQKLKFSIAICGIIIFWTFVMGLLIATSIIVRSWFS